MKVTQEKLPASQIGLEIEITPEMSKQAYEKTVQEFTRSANIPGFRKGKVPRQILIQRLGQARIKAAAIEDLLDSSLKKAIEQEKINAIGNFNLRSPFEELLANFEPGAAFTFSAAVDVPPEPNLKQYKGLTVQAEEIKYDPARVDETLENYRKRNATVVPVEGRSAESGDIAVVDFSGRLAEVEEGETEPREIPGGSGTDFEVELLEGRFIPGFIEGVIGMSAGETKEVSATFPDGYPQADLAGKPAVFTITLKEIKARELPELDDDFAQDISEFETLAALRESLEKRYQEEAEGKTRQNKEKALLNELLKHLEAEVPETLIRREMDSMLTQTMLQFGQQGFDIRQTFTPEIMARLREQSRPEAILRIKRSLALGEVAKIESIKVDEDALNEKVQEYLAEVDSQEIDMERLRDIAEEDLLKEKIFGWLEENGTVELVPEGTLKTEEAEEATEGAADDVEALETADATETAITVDVTSEGAEAVVETESETSAAEVETSVVSEEPAVEASEEESAPEEEPAPKASKGKKSKKDKASE